MAQTAFSADVRQGLNILCFAKKNPQLGWCIKQDSFELFLLFADFRLRNFDKGWEYFCYLCINIDGNMTIFRKLFSLRRGHFQAKFTGWNIQRHLIKNIKAKRELPFVIGDIQATVLAHAVLLERGNRIACQYGFGLLVQELRDYHTKYLVSAF